MKTRPRTLVALVSASLYPGVTGFTTVGPLPNRVGSSNLVLWLASEEERGANSGDAVMIPRVPTAKIPLLWQKAVQRLPASKILPLKLGGGTDAKLAAWRGDKRLGAAAVDALMMRNEKSPNNNNNCQAPGSATETASLALSNSFFALHSPTVLPGYECEVKQMSDREVGTMLEAAVDLVYDEMDDKDAVFDLACFLIEEAFLLPNPDSKGILISLGGKVEARRKGGYDHDPIFEAKATLEKHTCVSTAGNRRKAEQLAAEELLRRLPKPDFKGILINLGGTVEATRTGGYDHDPIFEAKARIQEHTCVSTAGSKKKAEQLAAEQLLRLLDHDLDYEALGKGRRNEK